MFHMILGFNSVISKLAFGTADKFENLLYEGIYSKSGGEMGLHE